MKHRGLDRQHRRGAPPAAVAIGAQQFVETEPPNRHRHRRQPFGHAAQKRNRRRGAGGPSAFGRRSASPRGASGDAPARRRSRRFRLVFQRRLRQQQARFQIRQPRRHHQVIGGDLQAPLPLPVDKSEVLVGQAPGSRSWRDRPFARAPRTAADRSAPHSRRGRAPVARPARARSSSPAFSPPARRGSVPLRRRGSLIRPARSGPARD